jgi:predicted secreted protein
MGNSIAARDYLLEVSEDAGVSFLPMAGIKTREFTRENPVTDTTNQADTGNETSSGYTGYGTVTIAGQGVMDTRVTGLYTYIKLATVANSANPVLLCRLSDSTGETYEGNFTITSFSKTGEQQGVVEFSIALQNEEAVTFTPGT